MPLSSLQHAERRWAQFNTTIRRGKETHTSMWKKHLEILLHCWVIWKVAELPTHSPTPAPHSGGPFWRFGDSIWRFSMCGSPGAVGGGGGGLLGLPSRGLSPKHKELVFWRFLLSYMTSGPFSWWYFLLLKQRFFWYYFSYSLMCGSKSSFRGTAGIHNTSVVCNLYCDRSSDQQETSGQNLKGFDKLIIINDIHKTQQLICSINNHP